MMRKKGFKVSICFTMVLMLLLSFSGVSALASDSKVVSVTVPQSINCPDTVINDVLQSISQSTYNYDDGTYKGTLSYSSISNFASTFLTISSGYFIYNYTFDVLYTGTVTNAPTTKTVTVTTSTYSIIAPLAAESSIRQSVSSATMNYDDGSYSGTLHCTEIANWNVRFYSHTDTIDYYEFTFQIVYSGTVTKY